MAFIYVIGDESAFASEDEGELAKGQFGKGGGKCEQSPPAYEPDTAYVSYRDLKKAKSMARVANPRTRDATGNRLERKQ
jgi:hypothetical protein